MKKIEILFFSILFILAVVVRLKGYANPIADWHSWRQADTAAVARNFVRFGVDPLHPRYDDFSNIQTGKDNPNGWRMVEFPAYQMTGVYLYKVFPAVTLETCLRFVSILSTAGSVVLLGLLLSEFAGLWTGILGAFLYAILPFSIYYGRTILPDPFATFFALGSLYLLSLSNRKTGSFMLVSLAGLAGAVSLLVRPMAVFLLFPALSLLFYQRPSIKNALLKACVYGSIVVLPLLWWRKWILQYPEGIAASDWLFNKDNVRFKGAWFYWLFARRLGELILGWWGVIPFGIGLATRFQKKEGWFSFLWILGALSYFIIFAGGNVQHDYYQALLIPIVVWFTAIGFVYLCKKTEGLNRFSSIAVSLISIIFLWAFSWYTIRTYFWINRPEIVEAGRAADKLLPNDAKVIAPYNGDTTFLYQTNRRGWPIGFDMDNKIKMGAQYYVTVSPTDNDLETRDLAKKYTVLVRNDKYAIIDLTKKK